LFLFFNLDFCAVDFYQTLRYISFMKHKLAKLFLLCACAAFSACVPRNGKAEQSPDPAITIYGLKGPSSVGMLRLFENPPEYKGAAINVSALAQADLLAAQFISGGAKIGILPANVAAKIASSGKRVQIAAVVGTGMLSLLTSDPEITRIENLRGKNVEVAGQGATPDYVFRKILLSKNIKPDSDLQLNYALAYPEIAQSLIAGRVSTALLPEPFATMALAGSANLRAVSDIQREWALAGGSDNYPMTALVVDADFAAKNPALVRTILEAFKSSIEWVVANPEEAGTLAEKHELGLRAAVVKMSVPKSNYVFIPATEARASLESLYHAFLEFDPLSIGGALPRDDFYYAW
jgi:NitT/TauT family transport system substrate-binding protein